MKPVLLCPRCGSFELTRPAKNEISPFRGYRCGSCGRRLRDRGSLPLYLIALAIGLLMLWGFAVTLDKVEKESKIGRATFLGLAGLIGAGYALVEIARPTPRIVRPGSDDPGDRWSVARNGGSLGPFTFAQLRRMAESGAISLSDMVLDPKTNGWTSAGLVAGLFDVGSQVFRLPDKTGD